MLYMLSLSLSLSLKVAYPQWVAPHIRDAEVGHELWTHATRTPVVNKHHQHYHREKSVFNHTFMITNASQYI